MSERSDCEPYDISVEVFVEHWGSVVGDDYGAVADRFPVADVADFGHRLEGPFEWPFEDSPSLAAAAVVVVVVYKLVVAIAVLGLVAVVVALIAVRLDVAGLWCSGASQEFEPGTLADLRD